MGYQRAGFEVTSVDINPQPNNPLDFVQADAFEFLAEFGHRFDVVTGSPMCRDHTALTSRAGLDGSGWQLARLREMFIELDKPWVIENVVGAPMRPDVRLCGNAHFGLRTVRHRWFESEYPLESPPFCGNVHTAPSSTRKRKRDFDAGMLVSVTGDVNREIASVAMGIDWMTRRELAQAIPPAYTEYIGQQLLLS